MVVVRAVSVVAFGASVASLLIVDACVWRRTAWLRRDGKRSGVPSDARREPPKAAEPDSKTSPATYLAAAAGAAALSFGIASGVAVIAVSGAFVLLSGAAKRVTHVEASAAGVRIRYALAREFRARNARIVALRPPRTPLGAWRIVTDRGGASLMPSDVFGREAVLGAIVACGGLRRAGRAWSRRADEASPAVAT